MAVGPNIASKTALGTVSGTVLTVAANIGSSDVIKTVTLAVLGTVVSFCMSVFLKWITSRFRK